MTDEFFFNDFFKFHQENGAKYMAKPLIGATDGYAHECDVILPAEELFAQQHGMTAERLEDDWGKRRVGSSKYLCRQGAELRDQFYAIVDEIAEANGKTYDDYIHEIEPQNFIKAFKEKTGL